LLISQAIVYYIFKAIPTMHSVLCHFKAKNKNTYCREHKHTFMLILK